MAHTSRTTKASLALVWKALVDPLTYPQWLIGTKGIRDVEPDWPAVGSGFHHTVGVGPFAIADRSEVICIEYERCLELAVKARPFVSARARFELITDGERTTISLEEEPTVRFAGNLVRPALDPATHVRNHRSLRNLDEMLTGLSGTLHQIQFET